MPTLTLLVSLMPVSCRQNNGDFSKLKKLYAHALFK